LLVILQNNKINNRKKVFSALVSSRTGTTPLSAGVKNGMSDVLLKIDKRIPSTTTNFTGPVNTCYMFRPYWQPSGIKCVIESSWNVMAHGDAREVKWRGKWRMEWVASRVQTPIVR